MQAPRLPPGRPLRSRLYSPSLSPSHSEPVRFRKEERRLPGRILVGVRRVDGVALLGLGIEGADGAGRGLCRVRGADRLAKRGDGVVALEQDGNARSGGHERDEGRVERPFAVDRIELAGLCLREAEHADGADAEPLLFEVSKDLSGTPGGNGVGLDDRECQAHVSDFLWLRIGAVQRPNNLRMMSLRVRKPVSLPSLVTGNCSTSLLIIMLAASSRPSSSEMHSTERVMMSRTRSVSGTVPPLS